MEPQYYGWEEWNDHGFVVIDRLGQIAEFSCGYALGIPDHLEVTEEEIGKSLRLLQLLPEVTTPDKSSRICSDKEMVKQWLNRCLGLASRGVWCYDYDYDLKKYISVADPGKSCLADETLRAACRISCGEGSVFAHDSCFVPSDLFVRPHP